MAHRRQRPQQSGRSHGRNRHEESTSEPTTSHGAQNSFDHDLAVQEYYRDIKQLTSYHDWRSLPEIPTADELKRPVEDPAVPITSADNDLRVFPNATAHASRGMA